MEELDPWKLTCRLKEEEEKWSLLGVQLKKGRDVDTVTVTGFIVKQAACF